MNKADMIYDLSSLWASVKEEFPYFDRLTFDWDELYYSFLERLDSVNNEADFHHLLEEFMESLNDGHTKYLPPKEFRTPQQQNRLERPSHTVNDKTLTIKLNDFLFDHSDYVRELLRKNSDAELVRLDIRDNIGGNTFYAANVAKLFISGVFHGCQKWTQIRNAVDVASASQITRNNQERLQQYIDDGLLKEEDIIEAKKEMNHTRYETYTDIFGSEDNKAVYNGELQVLISKRTISAAEDFTAMFKSSKRATLIGEPTFGSTGTPYIIKLRCGGHGQVVSVGYRLLDGTEFIGKGIEPDLYSEDN